MLAEQSSWWLEDRTGRVETTVFVCCMPLWRRVNVTWHGDSDWTCVISAFTSVYYQTVHQETPLRFLDVFFTTKKERSFPLWCDAKLRTCFKRIIRDCDCVDGVAVPYQGARSGNESCPASSISRGTKIKKKRPLRVIAIAGVTSSRIYSTTAMYSLFDGFSPNSLLFSLSLFSNSLFLGCRNLSDRLPMLDDPSIIFVLKMEEHIARMVAPFWELLLITNPAFFCLSMLFPFFIWMTLLLLYSWYRCTQF